MTEGYSMAPVGPEELARGSGGGTSPYSSWGRRLGAFLLDGVMVTVVAMLITAVSGHHEVWNAVKFHTVGGKQKLIPVGSKLLFYFLASNVVGFLYAAGTLSSAWRATPGMRLVGIRLARQEGGGDPERGRAVWRAAIFQVVLLLASFVAPVAILILVDLLWPLWDPRRQTLHDKLARTVVVPAGVAGS
jgi:uncharacterized RDD family membrane protein YckC